MHCGLAHGMTFCFPGSPSSKLTLVLECIQWSLDDPAYMYHSDDGCTVVWIPVSAFATSSVTISVEKLAADAGLPLI